MLQPNSALSHIDFQHSVALKLTQNPLAIGRKYAPQLKLEGRDPMVDPPTHHFIRLGKKTYCDVCRARRNPRTRPRLALAPVDGNRPLRTKRPAQTTWGCGGYTQSACCHSADCFRELHRGKFLD